MGVVASYPAILELGRSQGADTPIANFSARSIDTALSDRFDAYLRRFKRGDAPRLRPRHVTRTLAKLESRRQDVLERFSNEVGSGESDRNALKLAVLDRQIDDARKLLDWVSNPARR
ncbi:hypothetical protein R3X27_21955 [Tropicimonas sp. TH_r6]|uniref:hypothetical protein n=1 Tax=Tropicimonas sp. TH_r6 TaxID=3082085 RepID=UPI002952DAD2|nr:hypothetical protein [Tropicimonas sp. TH_r6]MDV7145358.1 hypothetical protein [Tropicimonas sp. TH_r6]